MKEQCLLLKEGVEIFKGYYSDCYNEAYRVNQLGKRWEPIPPPFNKTRNPEYSIIDIQTGADLFI